MLDLMRRFGLPIIVAARTALGTINHTLLTLAALRGANLNVRGVVMIGKKNTDNQSAIEHFGNVRVIGYIPPLEKIHRAALLEVFEKHFDRLAFR
jgi:malonyl-CoA O-methyltransferase